MLCLLWILKPIFLRTTHMILSRIYPSQMIFVVDLLSIQQKRETDSYTIFLVLNKLIRTFFDIKLLVLGSGPIRDHFLYSSIIWNDLFRIAFELVEHKFWKLSTISTMEWKQLEDYFQLMKTVHLLNWWNFSNDLSTEILALQFINCKRVATSKLGNAEPMPISIAWILFAHCTIAPNFSSIYARCMNEYANSHWIIYLSSKAIFV